MEQKIEKLDNMDDERVQSRKKSSPQPHPKKLKVLTTAAIYFGNISLGYCINVFAPALEDIRSKYSTTIEQISIVFTVQLVAYCVGAIIYGFVAKYVNRQILIIAALTGMAFSLYMTPHCPSVLVFFIVGGINGLACGVCDAAQIVWVIEIWQEKAAPFILSQHLFFAIGSAIPSVVIAPFLSNTTTPEYKEDSKIYIPFTILGAVSTIALLFQALLFTFCRYYTPPLYASEAEQDLSEENKVPTNDSPYILGISKRRLQLIAVTGFFLGAYQGMEVCSLQFIPIFGQYSDLNMSESASAYVLSGVTGMFAVGRLVGVVLILKMKPEVLLCVNFVMIVTANVILLVWATNSLTMFWIGCILLGAGFSTTFPSFCAFIEKYLVFTNPVGSFICVIGSTFAAVYPLIVGRFIERQAIVMTYTNFFSTAICILAVTTGYLLTRKAKSRV